MIAASDGNDLVVQELLKAGADPAVQDRWGQTALDCATYGGHLGCINSLTKGIPDSESFANDEKSSLRSKSQLQVKSTDIDQNARSICTAAADGNIPELQRLLVRLDLFQVFASLCFSLLLSDSLPLLVEQNKGVDVNCCDYDNRTPLHIASASGMYDVVEFLCSNPSININAIDRWHSTPLTDATRQGNTRVAALLRSKGAVSVNRNLGYRLCSAAATGDMKELEQCLYEGANLNAADYDAR